MPALAADLLDAPLAIVDLETTGAHAGHDRITEIAVIEVEGGEVRNEWSTLVNPQTSIPAFIQALTGISNEMVAGAPSFAELAEELHARLAGRVIVAHNARFDYGFLKNEFERHGLRYNARTLCTVRLSRKLYPEHNRHSLDALIERHKLSCEARHRALGDAQVLWQFMHVAARDHGLDAVAEAARAITKQATLPPALERAAIDAIPDAPGVYLFYGEGDAPLYIGKSIAMRTRVLQHFSDDVRSSREMQMAREVRSIDWIRTAGELGALLKEAELVKQRLPAFNRQLRRASGLCTFTFEPQREPGQALRLVSGAELEADSTAHWHGLFRTKRAATEALRNLADLHGLCLQTLGFEAGKRSPAGGSACFRHQVRRCAGLCAGKETLAQHHARLAAALAGLKLTAWPWRGPVGIVEEDLEREMSEVHVVDHWCYLGTARNEEEVAGILERHRRLRGLARFDIDQYKLLLRHLGAGSRMKIVPLADGRNTDAPDAALPCAA
ncbi:MAG: ethanolamine utilization protein [Betaproteobacteria bacterium]|nr:ethanolamine utilization protein [Betaproteobacteria bacterium]